MPTVNVLAASLVACILAAPICPAVSQPRSQDDVLRLVRDTTGTYGEGDILRVVAQQCLAFVPTPDKTDLFVRARPALSNRFVMQLISGCYGNVRFERLSEIRFLLQHKPAAEVERIVMRDLQNCPPGGDYRNLRGIALQGATSETIARIASVCDLNVRPGRFEVSLKAGYTPLSAADAIRAERMSFAGGAEISVSMAYIARPQLQVGLELERALYAFDPEGLDFEPEGRFTLLAGSVSVRYLVNCFWAQCGSHLLSRGDLYVQGIVSFNDLSGRVDLGKPISGSAAFSFDGPGCGIETGYLYRLSRAIGVSFEGGYTWIDFNRVSVLDASGNSLQDRVGGTSGRSRLGISFAYMLPL